jgi:small subunit ribosomal protein S8
MSVTDPIADMLARMRNASLIKRRDVTMPSSKLKVEIAKILKEEGFIKAFKVAEDGRRSLLTLTLKYTEANQSVISGTKRVSKPGCRIYCTKDAVPQVQDGLGVAILSTSKGLATGRKCEELGLGGEVVCYVW